MNIEKLSKYIVYYIFDYLPSEEVIRYTMTSKNTFYKLFNNTKVVTQNLLEYEEHYKRNKRYYEKTEERLKRINVFDRHFNYSWFFFVNGNRPIDVQNIEQFTYRYSYEILHDIVKNNKDKRFCNFIYHNRWRPRNHNKWRLKIEHRENTGFLTYDKIN